jgi:hypothetical protein
LRRRINTPNPIKDTIFPKIFLLPRYTGYSTPRGKVVPTFPRGLRWIGKLPSRDQAP